MSELKCIWPVILTGEHPKIILRPEPCQNILAAGNFAAFSPFLAAYFTLDFTMSPLAGKGTWCLLPAIPSMLPTATKHFDRAGLLKIGLDSSKSYKIVLCNTCHAGDH